jgi:phosphoadenosine phosphosulfate reductase
MLESLREALVVAESWSAEDVLHWAFGRFGNKAAIASAFGAEGMVLIDIASRVLPDFRVFTLDTEFLFPETYDLMETVEERYGIKIERVRSAFTPEEQERLRGLALWSRDPDQCCTLRKIEPLRKKLAELHAWITAIRRDQTAARSSARKVEWDSKFQRVKINPLVDWTATEIWHYIREHAVPYNPLHDRDYPSIGCTHCTRAIKPGEAPRAGRWSNLQKTECGLHAAHPRVSPIRKTG